MPRIDQSATRPLFEYAGQIASGMGHSLTTAHLLMAIANQAEDELKSILEEFQVIAGRVMDHYSELSNEHPSIMGQAKEAAMRACVFSNSRQQDLVHVMIGILALTNSAAYRVLWQLEVDCAALQARLVQLSGIRQPRHRQAGEPAGISGRTGPADLERRTQPITTDGQVGQPAGSLQPLQLSRGSALAACSKDLVLLASQGKIDPIIGREQEIGRAIQILCKRNKNNPVFIGEAGVGKTAVVEGIAARMATNQDIPVRLQNKRIFSLDLASVVAGTQFRGQFEDRLRSILQELEQHPEVIIFLDELHTVVGAGSSAEGTLDAANIMKPALSHGNIRCIGATTLDEYRRIEKDPALERRFQPVHVDPPNEEQTLAILGGLSSKFEQYHGVRYTPEAIEAAVRFSVRYIYDRNLPDKAIDLLDEAGSRKSLEISSADSPEVYEDDIAHVVREWTGIPVMSSEEEKSRMIDLEPSLKRFIIGQDEAVHTVASALLAIKDPLRPFGSFIFLGPTGVGKTELAKKLALSLFDSEDALIRFDMSEYQEKHTISRLIGAPPGYVGHEEGGQLTERVRRRPYAVILLDEIEKAHPDIFHSLLQVMDDGVLTDGQGRSVKFYNTVVIMTSNVQVEREKAIGFGATEGKGSVDAALRKRGFALEFLNRVDAKVVFDSLDQAAIGKILEIQLDYVSELLTERQITVTFTQPVKEAIAKKGFSKKYGARHLKRIIKKFILNTLGAEIARNRFVAGDKIQAILEDDKILFQKETPE